MKIKVLFITQVNEIHSSIILAELARSKNIEIIGVVTSKTLVHKKNLIGGLIYIYKKTGLIYIAMRAYEAFFGAKSTSVADLIKKYQLYHLATSNINNKHSLNTISELKPDVIVSCVFNQIYGRKLIGLASKGIINIHRSYLPSYRGVSPTFWVLANNEKETGITAHLVTPKIDVGPILLQRRISIAEKDTVHTLSKKLMESIKKDFVSDLIKYVNNEKKLEKISAKGSYYSWPTRKAVLKFLKNRKKLI